MQKKNISGLKKGLSKTNKIKEIKKSLQKLEKPRLKKTSWYQKKADDLFSKFIRQRDGGRCITCGIKKPWKEMQAGHYITRGCIPLRYSVINVNCQCVGCNIFKKGNYPIYSIKMMQLHGDNILYELNEIEKESKANPQKYGRDYYQKIIKLYS